MTEAKQNADMRPWRVTIKATVTKELEVTTNPAWVKSMEDAVSNALDSFRMEHERDEYRIESVSVDHNPQSREGSGK